MRLSPLRSFVLPLLATWLASSGCASWFAPSAKLRGLALEAALAGGHSPGTGSVDHGAWATVLAAAVHEDTARVDYAAVPKDVLAAYRSQLAEVDLAALSSPEQEALLINAYNALTLSLIVEQQPLPASIRDLPDPWSTQRWTVAGQTVSLDDIEHGLLRPIFRAPRLHFALNCASVGCPPLRATPFTGDQVDQQLAVAVADTLSRPGWLHIDGNRVVVTALLNWYGADFVSADWSPRADSRAEWLADHAPTDVANLLRSGQGSLQYADYDWRLNDVGPPVKTETR